MDKSRYNHSVNNQVYVLQSHRLSALQPKAVNNSPSKKLGRSLLPLERQNLKKVERLCQMITKKLSQIIVR
jgi:hypothetical protein